MRLFHSIQQLSCETYFFVRFYRFGSEGSILSWLLEKTGLTHNEVQETILKKGNSDAGDDASV